MSEAVIHSKFCSEKLSVGKETTPKHFSGGFYSCYELVCSDGCAMQMQMKVEIDIFREKPDADLNCNAKTANDSAITKVFQEKPQTV